MSLATFVGRRYLFARRRQAFISLITLISVAGVAVGVMALIIALAISTGFTTRIQEKIQLLNAHLNVLGGPGEMSPEETEAVYRALSADPRVKAFTPVVLGTGLASGPTTRVGVVAKVVGVEPSTQRAVVDVGPFTEGSGFLGQTPDGAHGAVLGADLAQELGVGLGDTVQLLAPRLTLSPFGSIPKLVSLKVTGILRTGYYLYDTGFVYVDLGLARTLFAGPGRVSAVQVRLADPSGIAAVAGDIQRALGPGFRVLDLIATNEEFFKALRMERVLLFLAIGLIVMVAALNIISTLILLVMEKVRDIGILRSMGASATDIRGVFLFQGMVIGAVGTLLGACAGVAACLLLDRFHAIPLSLDVYPLPYVPFITSPGQVAAVSAFALAVSFLATLYPSTRASRLDPVEALRYE
ncbi:MAG: ABC transporter permease [Acidobacteriota bacterium]